MNLKKRQGAGMDRRGFIKTVGAAAAAAGLPGVSLAAKEKKTNVVIILADDLGYCDTSLYGCQDTPTPNLEALAASGVTFTDGYVTNPVCSPSRAGLLSGRYQQRFGFEYNTGPLQRDIGQSLGLPDGVPTMADFFKSAGYSTGMVGKWHLGTREKFFPLRHGFQEFFGFTFGGTWYADFNRPDVHTVFGRNRPTRFNRRNPIQRGETPVNEEEYLTDAFTREAVAFIDRHAEDPFFLYVPYNAPHTPLQATDKYYDRFPEVKDESKRIFRAMVSAVDDGVGAIMAKLKEKGLEENTMLVFLSDNGCATYTNACSNDPLRFGKITQFEGGVRVPFALKLPGKVKPGQEVSAPVSSLDLFPTLAAACGLSVPAAYKLEGMNILPALAGQGPFDAGRRLFWRNGPNWAVREGSLKLFQASGHYWLYDLADDKEEGKNLAEARPKDVARLKAAYEEWNKDNIEPLWPPRGIRPIKVDGVDVRWHL